MNRPNITPGPWRPSHCNINAVSHGEWFQIAKAGCRKMTSAGNTANAQAIAALPDLLAALEGLILDKYLADPINADRMAPAKAALIKAGYTF